MKKLLILILTSFSMIFVFSNFECENNKNVLLVLQNVLEEEKFSVFKILKNEDGVIVAKNADEDYNVEDGIYRIEGSSNNNYYHKNVMVIN